MNMNEQQNAIYNSLSDKQKVVVCKLIEGASYSEAYRATGYIGRSSNSSHHALKISQIPKVKKLMDSLVIERSPELEEAISNRNDILVRLTEIARANIMDIVNIEYDDDGVPLVLVKNKKELSEIDQRVIKTMTPGKFGIKVELHDPMKAMEQLSKMQGFNDPEKFDVKVEVDLTDDERAKIDKQLDETY